MNSTVVEQGAITVKSLMKTLKQPLVLAAVGSIGGLTIVVVFMILITRGNRARAAVAPVPQGNQRMSPRPARPRYVKVSKSPAAHRADYVPQPQRQYKARVMQVMPRQGYHRGDWEEDPRDHRDRRLYWR